MLDTIKEQLQHLQGQAELNANEFSDVLPWDFNHENIAGRRTTPVGVFLDSHACVGTAVLKDLAGNVGEWTTSSVLKKHLEPKAVMKERDPKHFVLRGGGYLFNASTCRVGCRVPTPPDLIGDLTDGLRLVLGVAL